MEGRDPARARRDPASLQAEIERTQARLVSSMDAIADRTNPRNAARRGLRQLRDAGGHLVEEARTLVTGGAVRLDSEVVEPPEGSVRLKHDDEVVSTYSARRSLPPEAVAVGVGVGVVVAVGLVVLWRRRRRR
ncbi:DUF3618 domain-containing protein [Marinactinospora rubrisoli]|uniref:DUF3618 domain-containing protein n=1 Tax=Marinactinospora rubrisoli TaxID=2715399 RepID=A0ABW2KLF9_9ACTN